MRSFNGKSVIVATHNKGKLGEFVALLKPYVSDVSSNADHGLPEPVEDGATFADNARLKALAAAKAAGMIALADDSGLCISALDGRPGLYSGRWVEQCGGASAAMQQLNEELGNSADRSAQFVCCLALAWPDGHTEVVEEKVCGTITWPPRGTNGHGYDPFFVPDGESRTFAELSDAEKNAVSHRGKAMRHLIDRYFA